MVSSGDVADPAQRMGVSTAVSQSGFVWTVTLYRPRARNAVDGPTASALHSAFEAFERDEVSRVAVLHGLGGNFCAGADLKAFGTMQANRVDPVMVKPEPTAERVGGAASSSGVSSSSRPRCKTRVSVSEEEDAWRLQAGPMGPTRMQLSKPVIAAIEGFAVAGGLELACWADLRVASSSATLGVFCRRWGVPLIDGGTVRLPRLIGHGCVRGLRTGRPTSLTDARTLAKQR